MKAKSNPEYTAFSNLLKRIVSVPTAELKARLKEDAEKRKQKRSKKS